MGKNFLSIVCHNRKEIPALFTIEPAIFAHGYSLIFVLGRVDKGVRLFTPYPPDLISGTQKSGNFPVISCLPEKWWMRFASSTLHLPLIPYSKPSCGIKGIPLLLKVVDINVEDCGLFFVVFVLMDIELFHKNRTRNNALFWVLILICNFHIRRNIDRHL